MIPLGGTVSVATATLMAAWSAIMNETPKAMLKPIAVGRVGRDPEPVQEQEHEGDHDQRPRPANPSCCPMAASMKSL